MERSREKEQLIAGFLSRGDDDEDACFLSQSVVL